MTAHGKAPERLAIVRAPHGRLVERLPPMVPRHRTRLLVLRHVVDVEPRIRLQLQYLERCERAGPIDVAVEQLRDRVPP